MPSNNEINKFPYAREIIIWLDTEKNATIIDLISYCFNLTFFISYNDNNIKKITCEICPIILLM